jgi:hypothetical protein
VGAKGLLKQHLACQNGIYTQHRILQHHYQKDLCFGLKDLHLLQVYDKESIGDTRLSDTTQAVVLNAATVLSLQGLGFNVKSTPPLPYNSVPRSDVHPRGACPP